MLTLERSCCLPDYAREERWSRLELSFGCDDVRNAGIKGPVSERQRSVRRPMHQRLRGPVEVQCISLLMFDGLSERRLWGSGAASPSQTGTPRGRGQKSRFYLAAPAAWAAPPALWGARRFVVTKHQDERRRSGRDGRGRQASRLRFPGSLECRLRFGAGE